MQSLDPSAAARDAARSARFDDAQFPDNLLTFLEQDLIPEFLQIIASQILRFPPKCNSLAPRKPDTLALVSLAPFMRLLFFPSTICPAQRSVSISCAAGGLRGRRHPLTPRGVKGSEPVQPSAVKVFQNLADFLPVGRYRRFNPSARIWPRGHHTGDPFLKIRNSASAPQARGASHGKVKTSLIALDPSGASRSL